MARSLLRRNERRTSRQELAVVARYGPVGACYKAAALADRSAAWWLCVLALALIWFASSTAGWAVGAASVLAAGYLVLRRRPRWERLALDEQHRTLGAVLDEVTSPELIDRGRPYLATRIPNSLRVCAAIFLVVLVATIPAVAVVAVRSFTCGSIDCAPGPRDSPTTLFMFALYVLIMAALAVCLVSVYWIETALQDHVIFATGLLWRRHRYDLDAITSVRSGDFGVELRRDQFLVARVIVLQAARRLREAPEVHDDPLSWMTQLLGGDLPNDAADSSR